MCLLHALCTMKFIRFFLTLLYYYILQGSFCSINTTILNSSYSYYIPFIPFFHISVTFHLHSQFILILSATTYTYPPLPCSPASSLVLLPSCTLPFPHYHHLPSCFPIPSSAPKEYRQSSER